jgi:NAD(P)-dependent dehydrogenase (short-subunit alcohol dehydrogenase family)
MGTYLITGANRGIGLAFCQQLRDRGETIIAVCRESSPELDALDVRVETGVDLSDPSSIETLVDRLQGIKLDVLINNAGIWSRTALDDPNFEEDIRKLFEVNTLGTLRITRAFLPQLNKGSKIAIMTSRMASIDDNTSGSSYAYRMSKVALSMAGKSLSIDLKPRGIAFAILHPGLIATRMTGYQGTPPEEAAAKLIDRIDELNLDNSGTFWHANGEILPW